MLLPVCLGTNIIHLESKVTKRVSMCAHEKVIIIITYISIIIIIIKLSVGHGSYGKFF